MQHYCQIQILHFQELCHVCLRSAEARQPFTRDRNSAVSGERIAVVAELRPVKFVYSAALCFRFPSQYSCEVNSTSKLLQSKGIMLDSTKYNDRVPAANAGRKSKARLFPNTPLTFTKR